VRLIKMFRIKICGITNVQDAVAAVEAGADAIGLNFYEGSKRCVDAALARHIADSIAGSVEVVGVFVNASTKGIVETITVAGVKLSSVQTHGDETPEQFAHLVTALHLLELTDSSKIKLGAIRARRSESGGARMVAADLKECLHFHARPSALLVDAAVHGAYGGTGATGDWEDLALHRSLLGKMPLILAGGLTPDNVAEAIRIVRPAAVDVASGVESAPGKKDPVKVRDFVEAARAAFDALGERGA
jgi:phosphoribosylanthranilate isomerase